jgi:hypothetical protein
MLDPRAVVRTARLESLRGMVRLACVSEGSMEGVESWISEFGNPVDTGQRSSWMYDQFPEVLELEVARSGFAPGISY